MTLRVERAGLLTTVQDLGRWGYQHHGVSPGGAMDPTALRVANLLVGNPEGAAGLEVTLTGPTLVAEAPALIAVTGGDLGAQVNGVGVPGWRAVLLAPGDALSFAGGHSGARAYIAIAGGVAVSGVMGSRATDLTAGMGGHAGRALQRGDVIPVGVETAGATRTRARLVGAGRRVAWWGASPHVARATLRDPLIRIVRGPEHDWFPLEACRALRDTRWRVTDRSNRMGIRLDGGAVRLAEPRELVSSPVTAGTIQVPPGGEPIILMADRQTVGGYPRIAQVAEVDLSLLAQLAPGASLQLVEVTPAAAAALLLARERTMHDLVTGLAIHHL
ncbi:MAG: biotin-dependent carboxyltransferase family protein [Gemmatimonadetes bacterium]|nr:biotin-dependent carboxyltransferase family protein [Gemmatimonadota bacterium]